MVYFFINFVTGAGLNESVFYTLNADMEGAGVEKFQGLTVATIGVITFGVLLVWVAWRYQKSQNNTMTHRYCRNCQQLATMGQKSSLILQLVASSFVLLSFAVYPLASNLLQ